VLGISKSNEKCSFAPTIALALSCRVEDMRYCKYLLPSIFPSSRFPPTLQDNPHRHRSCYQPHIFTRNPSCWLTASSCNSFSHSQPPPKSSSSSTLEHLQHLPPPQPSSNSKTTPPVSSSAKPSPSAAPSPHRSKTWILRRKRNVFVIRVPLGSRICLILRWEVVRRLRVLVRIVRMGR
jgi:hypothetical protein